MIEKIQALRKSLGIAGLAQVASVAALTRLSGSVVRVTRPIGLVPQSWAMSILQRQSSDRASVELFETWLPLILESERPLRIWVPSYMKKGFVHIIPFIHSDSVIVGYQDTDELDIKPDWIFINHPMMGLIAPALQKYMDDAEIVYEKGNFVLLKTCSAHTTVGAKSHGRHALLKQELAELVATEAETVIERHGLKFRVRPHTMDPGIIDEVRDEYFPWINQAPGEFRLVLDIGAQIGSFSVFMAQRLADGGKIYSFEPEPDNFRLFEENISLNGFGDKITAQQAAISDRNGKNTLFISSDNTGGNKLGVPEASSFKSVEVDTIDIDAFIRSLPQDVDLLKIDVEGWELPILRRMKDVLPRIKMIVGELQRSNFGSTQDGVEFLERAGFKVESKGDPAQLIFCAVRA